MMFYELVFIININSALKTFNSVNLCNIVFPGCHGTIFSNMWLFVNDK